MRKPSILAVLFGCSLMVGLAPAADEPKVEGDLASLQGEWTSKDAQGATTWKFEGNKLAIKGPGRTYDVKFTLDPKQTPRKYIDFEVTAESPNAPRSKAAGIYEVVDSETVKICFAAPDADRPTEYKTDETKAFSFELKKKK